MSFTSSYVMAGIGTFFILFWLFLYIKYRNAYDQVIDAIDRLHISDKISYLKEKVQGVFQEDAKEAANAAG